MIYRFSIVLCLLSALMAAPANATLWYVDNAAGGTNAGTSWTNAWQSIATLVANWASVQPGDTVYISGGTTSKTYNEVFTSIKSGTAGNVITVRTGQDANHNGTVIINPGSSNLFPEASLAYFHLTGNVNGEQRMQVTGTAWIMWQIPPPVVTWTSVRMSYIDFGVRNYVIYFYPTGQPVTGFEFDHNHVEKTANGADSTFENIGWNSDTNDYDTNLIHHNTITIHNDTILGPDLVKWGGGISFYDNIVTVISDGCGTVCGQHTDFFQLQMSHYKIYNNRFIGSADQGVFYSGFGAPSTMTGMLIYNNTFEAPSSPGGVYDIFALTMFAKPTINLVDVIIANNTIVDMTEGNYIISLGQFGSCTNCHFKNNLMKNSSGMNLGLLIDASVSVSNNTVQSSAVQFASYTQYATSTNDLRLAAGDTVAKDQGADLSALIPALDKDGITRPVGAAWDIGAYEYGTPPVLAAITSFRAANFTGATWAMLLWPANTEAGLAGFNVYRCTSTGACSNRIAQITSATAAASHSPMTQWFDSKLYVAGTYYYTIAPYNTSNVAGTISSEVSITVTGKQ